MVIDSNVIKRKSLQEYIVIFRNAVRCSLSVSRFTFHVLSVLPTVFVHLFLQCTGECEVFCVLFDGRAPRRQLIASLLCIYADYIASSSNDPSPHPPSRHAGAENCLLTVGLQATLRLHCLTPQLPPVPAQLLHSQPGTVKPRYIAP